MSAENSPAPVTLSPDKIAADILAELPPAPPAATPPETEVVPPPATKPAPDAEVDSAGMPFDPTRHIRAKNRQSGRWMPKGGRKPKAAATPPAPHHEPSAIPDAVKWTEVERATAAAPLAETKKPETAMPDAPPTASPDDAAEVAAQAIYLGTGLATGHPEEARLRGGDHASLRGTLSAYFRSKGWAATGGLAVSLALVAYLLRVGNGPKTGETIRQRLAAWRERQRVKSARPVSPQNDPVPVRARPPEKAEPVRMDVPPPKTASDPFSHLRS